MEGKNRKLNRKVGYDYSLPGYYFITICVKNFEYVFGNVNNYKMVLNQYGKIAENNIKILPKYYLNVEIDKFCIMPNHIHCIIVLKNAFVGTEQFNFLLKLNCSVPTVSKIVKLFKELVTRQIRKNYCDYSFEWQRSFYDSIIYNKRVLNKVRFYIKNNPKNWNSDRNKN